MLNRLKSPLYTLIITVFLFVMLTGCDFKNHGKADAVIEIDMTQQGKTLRTDMNRASGKGIATENRIQHKTTTNEVKSGTGNLQEAITEAALMIVLERNATVVKMTSDSSLSYKTPSEYAVKLFAENRPDKVMPTKVTIVNIEKPVLPSISATAGLQEKTGLVILKIVNPVNAPQVCKIILKYKQQIKYKGEAYVMTSGNILDVNSVKDPEKVVPMTKELKGLKNTFNYECPANSIVVIKLRYKKRVAGFGSCC